MVKAEFYQFTEEMRFAADFTICPSRTEPFGYVDVEHAWCATPTVGGLVGGLGKVPGIYYRALDGADRKHCLAQLARAVDEAIDLRLRRPQEWAQMAAAVERVTFPA